jgi:hypothetical protein
MRFGAKWSSLLCAVGAFLVPSVRVIAQTTGIPANLQLAMVSVPFVGCASFGQGETFEAPRGASRSVPISPNDAHLLAYYKSADGIGLLAPRGWYCEGVSGSSGYALFLSPDRIDRTEPGWNGFAGPAIEVYHITSENGSGRSEIAEIIARVFPAYKSIAKRVWDDDLPFPSGPFPTDTLKYRGTTIVEYKTPAQTEGLGNFDSWLKKNDIPIVGAAILIVDPPSPIGHPPDVVLVSVRLPPDLARLAQVIVHFAESDSVGAPNK